MNRYLAFLISVLALVGCNDRGTNLVVENQSSMILESIQAHGPGFDAYVGNLEPRQRTTIKIYPKGEAGLGLTFKANSREINSPVSGYFESGYEVSAVVTEDLQVVVDSTFQ